VNQEATVIRFTVNEKEVSVDAPPDTPLLWILREELGLTGTKFGCGMALCGACTVHVDGSPVRSCMARLEEVAGKKVLTIEGLAASGPRGEKGLHPVQEAWLEANVPQCGYCQAGQIMSTVALLRKKPDPTDDDIDHVLSANLCRCGTYPRIRKAVHLAALKTKKLGGPR